MTSIEEYINLLHECVPEAFFESIVETIEEPEELDVDGDDYELE